MSAEPTDLERDLRNRYLDLPTIEPATHERLRQAFSAHAGNAPSRRPRHSLLIAAAVAALGILASSALGFGPLDAIRALNPHDAATIRHIGQNIDQNNRTLPNSVRPVPKFAPARDSPILAHHEQIVDGTRWSFITYRNADGLTCGGVRYTGGQSLSCYPLTQMLATHPLSATFGGRQLNSDYYHWGQIWIEGFAAPTIRKLTLRFTDCSTTRVPLDHAGVLLYIVNHQQLRHLIWPSRLRAYDAHGHLIATQRIHLDAPNALSPSPPPRNCPT